MNLILEMQVGLTINEVSATLKKLSRMYDISPALPVTPRATSEFAFAAAHTVGMSEDEYETEWEEDDDVEYRPAGTPKGGIPLTTVSYSIILPYSTVYRSLLGPTHYVWVR